MAQDYCFMETSIGRIAVLPMIVRMFIAAELAKSNKFRPHRYGVSQLLSDYRDTKDSQAGIRVESDNGKVVATLRVEVKFGTDISTATKMLQERVCRAVKVGTGLDVRQVRIDVEGVFMPDEDTNGE